VFGGNNFVFGMGRKFRMFGGDKPGRLLVAFLLINIPGLIFHFYAMPDYREIYP
jgi:hypothetical protein